MQSGRTVFVHANVCPDDNEEEEEEFLVRPTEGASRPPAAVRRKRDTSDADGDGDDDGGEEEEEDIPYVARGAVAMHVSTARSSAQLKRTRSDGGGPASEPPPLALDTEGEASLLLPDDTDYPQDTAEHKRWMARNAARPKKLLLG